MRTARSRDHLGPAALAGARSARRLRHRSTDNRDAGTAASWSTRHARRSCKDMDQHACVRHPGQAPYDAGRAAVVLPTISVGELPGTRLATLRERHRQIPVSLRNCQPIRSTGPSTIAATSVKLPKLRCVSTVPSLYTPEVGEGGRAGSRSGSVFAGTTMLAV